MITEIKDKLVLNRINPSFHRIKIYEYLLKNRIHPSVEKIHSDLVEEIPSLSKTTVYNTLKHFGDKGLVLSIAIKENEQRFDAYTHMHGHFLCDTCGELYDIDIPESAFKESAIKTSHHITATQINFRGICENCKN